MAAILNSAILDSDTLLSSLRFTQKHSHSTLTLTQTNSIWLKLIHSDSTWWWQPSWILPSWIWPSWIQPLSFSSQTHSHLPRLVPTICTKKLHSFILTQLDDGSHLEFCHVGFRHCHLGFRHLVIFSQIHSKTLTPLWLWLKLIQSDKKTSLIHSDSTWWWQPSWILPSWIQPFCTKKIQTHSFSSTSWFTQNTATSAIWLKNFNLTQTHSFWLNLMMAAILNLPSWIQPS